MGVTTKTKYDKAGRTIETVVAEGTAVERRSRTEYYANGLVKLTAFARPDLGNGVEATSETTYTPGGRVSCVKTLVDASTETYSYSANNYDAAGRAVVRRTNRAEVAGCDDSPNDTSKWSISATEFDAAGDVVWQQNPTQYEAVPNPSDPAHVLFRTSFDYDTLGRLVSTTSPDPSSPGVGTVETRTCFGSRGETMRTVDATGAITAYGYYPSGRIATVTDPRGMSNGTVDPCQAAPLDGTTATMGYGYDSAGNMISRTSYDDAGAPLTETWTYDGANRETSHTDVSGNTSTNEYLVDNGILLYTIHVSGSADDPNDPSGSSLRMELVHQSPSGRIATNLYTKIDSDGETTSETYSRSSVYDEAGNLSSLQGIQRDAVGDTVSDQTVSFTYDPSGKIASVTYPNGRTASYGWDVAGRRVSAELPTGTKLRYRYATGSLIESVDTYLDGMWLPLADYTYDADGHRSSESMLGGLGGDRTWAYESSTGLLSTLDQDLVDVNGSGPGLVEHYDITFDRNGRMATECRSTSTSCASSDRNVSFDYDVAGQLNDVQLDNPMPDEPEGYAYRYDNRGRRVSETATRTGVDSTKTYSYDNTGQLVSSSSALTT